MNPHQNLRCITSTCIYLFGKVSPDLVTNFTIEPNVYGTFAASKLRIESINVISGLDYAFMQNVLLKSLVSSLYKLSFPRNELVVFKSNDDFNYFVSSPRMVPPGEASFIRPAPK